MATFSISSAVVWSAARQSVITLQADLARSQKELATGKRADPGLDLGSGVSEIGKLRKTQAWQAALESTNSIGATRLDAGQTALEGITDGAQGFLNQMLAAQGAGAHPAGIAAAATSALSGMTAALNTAIAGVHVFGGDNSGPVPLMPYVTAGSASSQAIAGAFATAFGFAPDDPQVANITPAQMQAFLDGPFASEFSDLGWRANWSTASDQAAVLKISTSQDIEVGVSANERPFRELAQAYVMVSGLGADRLNSATLKTVIDRATELTSTAIAGVTGIRARLGVAQQQLSSTNEQIAIEGQIISNRLDRMEAVDPYTAATTISTLMTQLQASYAATARIQQLSILNYL